MQVAIGNYHTEEQVGTVDDKGNLETDSNALEEVARPLIEDGIYSVFPYSSEDESGGEAITYREFHIEPDDKGWLREFFDALPSPYDCDMDVLGDLPTFDPNERVQEKLDKEDFPPWCRSCGEKRRMSGSFVCPSCHPDEDEESYDGELTGVDAKEKMVDGAVRPLGKERRYIDNPAEAPDGVQVQEGDRGGYFYETQSGSDNLVSGFMTEFEEMDEGFRNHLLNDEVAMRGAISSWASSEGLDISQDEVEMISEEIRNRVSGENRERTSDVSAEEALDGFEDAEYSGKAELMLEAVEQGVDSQEVIETAGQILGSELSASMVSNSINSYLKDEWERESEWGTFSPSSILSDVESTVQSEYIEEYGEEEWQKANHVLDVWSGYEGEAQQDEVDGWGPMHEETAPLWQLLSEETGNRRVENENLLSAEVSTEEKQALKNLRDMTQDVLRDSFDGDTVTVFRGFQGDIADEMLEAKEEGGSVEIEHRPVESWSFSFSLAHDFSVMERGDGALIADEVPIDNIWLASHTSAGLKDFDSEFLVSSEGSREYSSEDIASGKSPSDLLDLMVKGTDEKAKTETTVIDWEDNQWEWLRDVSSQKGRDEEEKDGVTTGSSGYSNATYGGVSGSEVPSDFWASEYMDVEKRKEVASSWEKSEYDYTDVDDMMLAAFKNTVQWEPSDDGDLSKAPNMWQHAENVPEFVKEFIREAVKQGVIWDQFEEIPKAAIIKVEEIFRESLTQPQGWSVHSLTEDLADEFASLSRKQAETIARNETAAILNTAREEAYKSRPDEEGYKYYWSNPQDHRTTDVCNEIIEEIDSRGGAVDLPTLKDILYDKAKKYESDPDNGGTPQRADEYLPHFACRSTFVREIYL